MERRKRKQRMIVTRRLYWRQRGRTSRY